MKPEIEEALQWMENYQDNYTEGLGERLRWELERLNREVAEHKSNIKHLEGELDKMIKDYNESQAQVVACEIRCSKLREEYHQWIKMLENAPHESFEVIRERALSSHYLKPIVEVWKVKLEASEKAVTDLEASISAQDTILTDQINEARAGWKLWKERALRCEESRMRLIKGTGNMYDGMPNNWDTEEKP